MRIRNFIEGDITALRYICLETGPELTEEYRQRINCLLYCDYYANENMDTSYAIVNDDNTPVGYVMCATNYTEYERIYREKYLHQIGRLSRKHRFAKSMELRFERKFGKQYHAHLHIDILPEAQRMGWGHKLIDTLRDRLAELGVPSVYLIVGKNNIKGNSFYSKYGFKLVKKYPFGNLFVLTIPLLQSNC